MRISVVIPTSNQRPAHLARAVRSVTTQRLGSSVCAVEVIVANNAASPLVDEVLADADRKSIRVVDASGVHGVSHARNTGGRASRFETLAFLDDDDWWTETYLEEMASAMIEGSYDLVYCGQYNWSAAGGLTNGKQPPVTLTIAEVFVRNPGIGGSNILMRRRAFEAAVGFDETMATSNDKDFIIRFLKHGLRYLGLQRRLAVIDVGSRSHLGRLSQEKIDSARRFYELHSDEVSEELQSAFRFRLRLWEAMLGRSWVRLGWLWLSNPRRRKTTRYWMSRLIRGEPLDV